MLAFIGIALFQLLDHNNCINDCFKNCCICFVHHAFFVKFKYIRTMIITGQYFIVTVAFISQREHVESSWNKAEFVRPAECKKGKPFLTFMLHMVIDVIKHYYSLTAVSFNNRIIQDQDIYSLWSSERTKCSSNFNCKKQKKFAPVVGSFIKKAVIRIL